MARISETCLLSHIFILELTNKCYQMSTVCPASLTRTCPCAKSENDNFVALGFNLKMCSKNTLGLPRWLSGKRICLPVQETQEMWVRSWVRKIPWSRKWQPTPVFLPGILSLAGYSPWDRKESDTTDHALP